MPNKPIVKREKLEAIIAHRDRSLELVKQGFELLRKADQEYRLASLQTQSVGIYAGLNHSDWLTLESDFPAERVSKLVEKCRMRVDQGTWQHIVNNTKINNLMDAEQSSELSKQLREKPPEVSVETAIATLEELYKGKDRTFRQSVVNIFRRLSNNGYKSNGAFAIGGRMIMTGATHGIYGWLDHTARERMSDLDRMLFL